MKTVRFTRNNYISELYHCNTPGDMAGEYVPAEVARELLAALVKLRDSFRARAGTEHEVRLSVMERMPMNRAIAKAMGGTNDDR